MDEHSSAHKPEMVGGRSDRSRGGYSLALLFCVTTLCAVQAAGIRLATQGVGSLAEAISATVVGLLIGSLIGGVAGAHQQHRGKGVLLGVGLGGAVGACAMPTVLIDAARLPALLATQFAGALIIALLGWFWGRRVGDRQRPVDGATAPPGGE